MIKREIKFYVFKKEDVDVVLDRHPLLAEYFQTISSLVRLNRIARNKKPMNDYVVCNQDEPYSEEIWKIILDGEKAKEAKQ